MTTTDISPELLEELVGFNQSQLLIILERLTEHERHTNYSVGIVPFEGANLTKKYRVSWILAGGSWRNYWGPNPETALMAAIQGTLANIWRQFRTKDNLPPGLKAAVESVLS